MKRILFLLIFFILSYININAQGVVVSEYFNVPSTEGVKQPGEWAELLITKAGVSLVGCKIRDNSGDGVWQPAFEFKDIPLWKNLHEGTIIVIYFKDAAVTDDDKNDGYIQVGAENTKYFKYLGTDPIGSLNLNQVRDMIQIIDASDNPIHTLGHAKSGDEGIFTAIPGVNKICYSDELQSNQGVAVLPGAKLADYDMGYDKTKVWTTKFSSSESSPGLPNKNTKNPTSNITFWRELRQAEWNAPAFSSYTVNSTRQVILKWKPLSNANESDEGYMLLRAESKLWPANSLPIDSKVYPNGTQIGSAVVIDHIQKFSTDTYTDKNALECGKDYIYALVAYRFDADNLKKDVNELTARGRAYNEINYAVSNYISMDKPKTPRIYTDNNQTDICNGESITIYLDENNLKGYTYQWIKDGTDINGETSNKISVSQGGNYSIRIVNQYGCEIESKVLKINLRNAPNVVMQEDKGTGVPISINKDTTYYLCLGSSLKLVAKITGKCDNIQWIKDGTILQEGSTKYSLDVSTPGEYQIFAYDGICAGKSITLTVKMLEVNLRIDPNSLSLDYDKNPTGVVKVTNLTDYDLILQSKDISLPVGFTIISPANAPYTIKARDFQNFTIRFDISEFKTINGTFDINAPCGKSYQIQLTGVRKKPNSTQPISELSYINFGVLANCKSKDTSFVIKLEGTEEVIMKSYKGSLKGYDVEFNPLLPTKLNDSEIRVYISFTTTTPAVYAEDILLDYTVAGEDATEPLKISLYGEKVVPVLDIIDEYTNFDLQLQGCDNSIDTLIKVHNKSPYPISISSNFNESHIQIKSLPINIESGDTVDIPVTINSGTYPPAKFIYEPCSVSSEEIKCNISTLAPDLSYNMNTDTLDFGKIDNCRFVQDSTISISFIGNGVNSTISNITTPLFVSYSGINIGDAVDSQNNQTINLTLSSGSDYTVNGKFEITLEPCGIKKAFYIKGERYTPKAPSVSENIVDFGVFTLGNPPIDKIITITNNSNDSLQITAIDGLNPPFSILNNDIPYTMKMGEKKDYTIRYSPSIEGKNQTSIKVKYNTYCDYANDIELTGEAKSGIKPAKIKLNIAQNIKVALADEVIVPIYISSIDTTTLSKCGIYKVKIGISYNPELLDLVSITKASGIISNISNIILTENVQGEAQLEFSIEANYNIQAGQFVNLKFLALLADTNTSNISFSSAELSSDIRKVELTTDNGKISLNTQCDLNNRIVNFSGIKNDKISIIPNPANDRITLFISVVSEELTLCDIYDNSGKKVLELVNKTLKPGNYSYILDLSCLQSGSYNIVFKNGININKLKLLIIK